MYTHTHTLNYITPSPTRIELQITKNSTVSVGRIANSTTEAEALSLEEACECEVYFNNLEADYWEILSVRYSSDTKTLVRTLKSISGINSRRLKIDLVAIKEVMQRFTCQRWNG